LTKIDGNLKLLKTISTSIEIKWSRDYRSRYRPFYGTKSVADILVFRIGEKDLYDE
jgi:hypothetical protein